MRGGVYGVWAANSGAAGGWKTCARAVIWLRGMRQRQWWLLVLLRACLRVCPAHALTSEGRLGGRGAQRRAAHGCVEEGEIGVEVARARVCTMYPHTSSSVLAAHTRHIHVRRGSTKARPALLTAGAARECAAVLVVVEGAKLAAGGRADGRSAASGRRGRGRRFRRGRSGFGLRSGAGACACACWRKGCAGPRRA